MHASNNGPALLNALFSMASIGDRSNPPNTRRHCANSLNQNARIKTDRHIEDPGGGSDSDCLLDTV